MTTTQFTVITTLIVSIITMTVLNIWLFKTKYELKYSPRILVLFLVMPMIRLLFPFEFPFTLVITSTKIYPAIFYPLIQPLFTIGELPVTVITIFIFVWVGGFLLLFAHNGYCYYKIKSCFKNATYSTDAFINAMVSKCLGAGKKPIPVICTDIVSEPMLLGGIKPTIILPNQPFNEEELYHILAHEVSHYKNKDLHIKYFAGLLSCFFWWIPQIHLLKRQLDCVLEIRADREVLCQAITDQKVAYLNTLLKIQTYKKSDTPLPVGSVAFTFGNKKIMHKRFCAIANDLPSSRRQKRKELIITVALSISLLFPFAVVLQPEGDMREAEGTYAVEDGDVYIIQRGELYDLYINHECVETFTEYSGERSTIPIINKKDG